MRYVCGKRPFRSILSGLGIVSSALGLAALRADAGYYNLGAFWRQATVAPPSLNKGSGADGALVVSANTNLNAAFTYVTDTAVASGATTFNVNSTTGISSGDEILILQAQRNFGWGAYGTYEFRTVSSLTPTSITVTSALSNPYVSAAAGNAANMAIVQKVPQYTTVTVNSGVTLSPPGTWGGYGGGVVAFRATGAVNVAGSIDVSGKGFRSGAAFCTKSEGPLGYQGYATSPPTGAGLEQWHDWGSGCDAVAAAANWGASAGGGGHATGGETAHDNAGSYTLAPGTVIGADAGIEKLLFGGAGGSTYISYSTTVCAGGNGGGAVYIMADSLTVSGAINAKGANGQSGCGSYTSPGGGAGGTIILGTTAAPTLGTNLVLADGGTTPPFGYMGQAGGKGGNGRILLQYGSGSPSGSTTPAYANMTAFASAQYSSISGTTGITADDTATSTITITLKSSSNSAIVGVVPTFLASGTANTYGTCSASNASGVSTCTLSSAVAETKTLALVAPAFKIGGTVTFVAGPCPQYFALVPANSTVGTTSDFCVSRFEARNVSGAATSQPSGTPWVSLNRASAVTGCSNAGYNLISNAQWQTVARSIEATSSNWSGGTVGSGQINRGHSDNSPASVLGVSNTSDPYDGTGNSSAQAPGSGWEQKRVHTLSNGQTIWDFSANAVEWVADSIDGSALSPPITTSASFTDTTYFPTSDTGNRTLLGPMGSAYAHGQGMGSVAGGSANAVLRGGYYAHGVAAGAFYTSLANSSGDVFDFLGFRCVKAGSLAFTTQPSSSGTSGAALAQQPVVTVQTLSGSTLSSSSAPVTLAAYSDSGCTTAAGGTLTVTTNPQNASSGVATFAGVQYSTAGTIYLGASSPGFGKVCSDAITLTAGVSCPTNFAMVPGNSAAGTYASFCVAKFEMKNVGGVPTSQPASTPWTGIVPADASSKCDSQGWALMSNAQWQTAARNAAGVAANWSSGTVGTGYLNRGHSDGTPGNYVSVSNTADPYSDTGNTSGQAYGSGGEQKRTHTLSNGEILWDLAGNAGEMVVDEVYGSLLSPALGTNALYEFTNGSYFPGSDTGNRALLGPVDASWDSFKYVGKVNGGSGGALHRGGAYSDGATAGLFSALLTPGSTSTNAFRCVKAGTLAFTTQPSSTGSPDTPFAQQPVVAFKDLSGATITGSSATITLSAYRDPTCTVAAPGNLSMTTNPVSAVSGASAFANVRYSSVGTIYLKATSPGFPSTCSNAITVATGCEPTRIVLTSGTSYTLPANWNAAQNTIEVLGAGGGGGGGTTGVTNGGGQGRGGGGGGGGGGYGIFYNWAIPASTTVSYAIGAGGAAGGVGAAGGAGGTTSITYSGVTRQVNGAAGGSASGTGGAGGAGSSTGANLTLRAGGNGAIGNVRSNTMGGGGGGGGGAAGNVMAGLSAPGTYSMTGNFPGEGGFGGTVRSQGPFAWVDSANSSLAVWSGTGAEGGWGGVMNSGNSPTYAPTGFGAGGGGGGGGAGSTVAYSGAAGGTGGQGAIILSSVSASCDITPDAFSFTSQTGLDILTVYTSDIVQITGITSPAEVLVSSNDYILFQEWAGAPSGEYRICSDAACASSSAWTSASTTITNGQYIQLRMKTTQTSATSRMMGVSIGWGSSSFATWTLTTL
jgi:hypothetical protein